MADPITTPTTPDPDDLFKDTRMSFGDHLEDLRVHLWRAITGFGVACIFGFMLGKQVMHIISAPVEQQLMVFYERRVQNVEKELAEQSKSDALIDANQPTGWRKVGFDKKQLEAFREGKSTKEINEFPQPQTIKRNDNFTEEERKKYEEAEGQVVTVWVREETPVDAVIATQKATLLVGRRPSLSTLNVQEAFMVYLKVSMATGFVIGSPWIFWQLWSFIAVGLYPSEKKLIHYYLPFSLLLFIAGILVCQFLVMPRAVEALLMFNEWLDLEPDLRLNEWLSFAVMMPLVFGIAFQTPLVMVFLTKLGIVEVQVYREKRKLIWFVLVILAAIITPSTDPWSLLLLWGPTVALFELGIILCDRVERRYRTEEEIASDEALIGV